MVNAINPDGKLLYRVGGISALALGIAYLIIFPLFAHVRAPPTGGKIWLKYLQGKTTVWWIILWLCVLTDFLYIPVALALYVALERINRSAMLLASAFVGLFVALDLAVTGRITPRSSLFMPQPRTKCSGQATLQLQIMPLLCQHPPSRSSMPSSIFRSEFSPSASLC
jgi:hypothetical protein